MSSAAPSRWTDSSMHKRVRRRYAAERRFRLLGLAAVGVSVLFLAFLLYTMGAKGLGGFTHFEARLPIDFSRSDLFLDPATLRGPDAAQTVAGAGPESPIGKGSPALYRPPAAGPFGGAPVERLRGIILRQPPILQ